MAFMLDKDKLQVAALQQVDLIGGIAFEHPLIVFELPEAGRRSSPTTRAEKPSTKGGEAPTGLSLVRTQLVECGRSAPGSTNPDGRRSDALTKWGRLYEERAPDGALSQSRENLPQVAITCPTRSPAP